MARLIYFAIASLDGFIEDDQGSFAWGAPDDEVSAFTSELEHAVGTSLYGRRMYETMVYWESVPDLASESKSVQEFAELWQAANKIVFSTTLERVSSARTRLERAFDPEMIRELKASEARDISINGPTLAAHAFREGLVDECQLLLMPLVLGGGKPALPRGVRLELELVDEHRFLSGALFVRYRVN